MELQHGCGLIRYCQQLVEVCLAGESFNDVNFNEVTMLGIKVGQRPLRNTIPRTATAMQHPISFHDCLRGVSTKFKPGPCRSAGCYATLEARAPLHSSGATALNARR